MITPTVAALSHLSVDNLKLISWTILIWWIPGLILLAVLGVRGWLLVTVAPVITVGMTVVAGSIVPLVGAKWTVVSALIAVAVMISFGAVARGSGLSAATPGPLHGWNKTETLAVTAGISVAVGVGFVTTFNGTRGLRALPQHHDAPFQGNAIRAIAESGDPRPSSLAWIGHGNASSYYYPNAYHVLESIVYRVSGNSIPAIMNGSLFVLVALILPLSLVALVRGAGGSGTLAAAAATMSTAYQIFPYDMLGASQLFPYAAGLSVLGGFIGIFVHAVRNGSIALCVPAALGATGVAGIHNSVAFVAAILAICFLVQECGVVSWRYGRTRIGRAAAISVGSLLLSLTTVEGAVAASGSVVGTSVLPVTETPSQSFGEALFLGHNAWWPQMSLALLSIVGGYLMFVRRHWRWLVAAHGSLLLLAMAAQTLPYPWAKLITAPWWNDRERIHAALAIGVAMSAGYALQEVGRSIAGIVQHSGIRFVGQIRETYSGNPSAIHGGIASIILLCGYLWVTDAYIPRNIDRIRVGFDQSVVSPEQQSGMERLRTIVPRGARVLNDMSDGSVWAYALSGLRPMFSHYDSNLSGDQKIILEGLNRMDWDPVVQRAVSASRADYVMIRTDGRADSGVSPGMKNLSRVRSLMPIWQNDGICVYRISIRSAISESPNSSVTHRP